MNIKSIYIYIPIFILTLIVSFFLNFDISNGGSSRDFWYHWRYILDLNEDIGLVLKYNHSFETAYPRHYPLHHLIFSRFDFLLTKQEYYLNFYFIISLLLPVLFYYCLENRFPEFDQKKKLFISSIIYFLPNFQASAIWGNSHISSLFFFLGSIYFLNNLEKNNEKKVNFNIFFVVFFMACAAYVRQYYIVFFPYLFLNILLFTRIKNIIFFCILSIILSIPGVFFYFNNPIVLGGFLGNYTNFNSSIIIVLSILFIHLFAFYISDLKYNFYQSLELFKNKKFSILFLLSSAIFLYIIFNFVYNGYLGGGLFYKISKILIGNNLLFFLTAFIGMFLSFFFFRKRIIDIFLILTISMSFSTGYTIFLKYFEPTVLIVLFLLIDKRLIKRIFNFNLHVIFFYFSAYWLTYFIYSANLIKKMHLLLPQLGILH